jgi:hypothetical protein
MTLKGTNLKPVSPAMLLSLLASAFAAGCSTQTLYASGQAWQRNECQKLNDKSERDRCLANASDSYDTYRNKADAQKQD